MAACVKFTEVITQDVNKNEILNITLVVFKLFGEDPFTLYTLKNFVGLQTVFIYMGYISRPITNQA